VSGPEEELELGARRRVQRARTLYFQGVAEATVQAAIGASHEFERRGERVLRRGDEGREHRPRFER
jgi:hypothetical protein